MQALERERERDDVCLSTSLRCGYGNLREGSGQNILPCVSSSPALRSDLESSSSAIAIRYIWRAAEKSGFRSAKAGTVIASPLYFGKRLRAEGKVAFWNGGKG